MKTPVGRATAARSCGRLPTLERSRRGLAVVVAAALLAAVPPVTQAVAAAFDVATLFDRLARERPTHARFSERRHVALLTEPLDSSGELTFTPPDRLEKRTTSPKAEVLIVDGPRLVLERGSRKQTLHLDEYPHVAAVVASIRGTLAGDLASLAREYSMDLDGVASKWRLVLRPRDASLASIVERIEIGGVEAEVRTVGIFQTDGDRSVMTISSVPAR